MAKGRDHLVCAVMIGVGATAVLDVWGAAGHWLFGIRPPNYGLVGRWFGHMADGRFLHDSIAASPPVPGELLIGWTAHYMIGTAFAGLLLAIRGFDWARRPTIGPALIFGIASVAAPFLVMQPGMGAGIASSLMPDPATARIRSLVTHGVFGVGLYVAGWMTSKLRSEDLLMIPARFAPVAFGFILSCLMSLLVSGIATFRNAGLTDGFFGLWMAAWLPSWLIAFPVVLAVAPVTRRIITGLVKS